MRDDDLDIRLDDAQPRAVTSALLLEHEPSVSVGYLGRPDMSVMPVYLSATTLRQIEGHAASYPEREVGGVLLGKRFAHNGSPFLVIQQSIPALQAESSATHVTFTHESWQQITTSKDRQFPELQIVGWYHSHPDLGLFLSRDDRYIQHNFFAEPWQVALVVDPINGTRAVFLWQHGALVQDQGLRLYAPAKEKERLKEYLGALAAGRHTSVQPAACGSATGYSTRLQRTEPELVPLLAGVMVQLPGHCRCAYRSTAIIEKPAHPDLADPAGTAILAKTAGQAQGNAPCRHRSGANASPGRRYGSRCRRAAQRTIAGQRSAPATGRQWAGRSTSDDTA